MRRYWTCTDGIYKSLTFPTLHDVNTLQPDRHLS